MRHEEIKKLSKLSRLNLSEDEIKEVGHDIESIVDYISAIQSFETNESALGEDVCRTIMREDGEPHESGLYTKRLLDEMPHRKGDYLDVKAIL